MEEPLILKKKERRRHTMQPLPQPRTRKNSTISMADSAGQQERPLLRRKTRPTDSIKPLTYENRYPVTQTYGPDPVTWPQATWKMADPWNSLTSQLLGLNPGKTCFWHKKVSYVTFSTIYLLLNFVRLTRPLLTKFLSKVRVWIVNCSKVIWNLVKAPSQFINQLFTKWLF